MGDIRVKSDERPHWGRFQTVQFRRPGIDKLPLGMPHPIRQFARRSGDGRLCLPRTSAASSNAGVFSPGQVVSTSVIARTDPLLRPRSRQHDEGEIWRQANWRAPKACVKISKAFTCLPTASVCADLWITELAAAAQPSSKEVSLGSTQPRR